jgi:hypothetical protein
MKFRKARQHPLRLIKKDGASRRATALGPLPEQVLRRAYAEPDELDGVSARQLAKFQSQKEPGASL